MTQKSLGGIFEVFSTHHMLYQLPEILPFPHITHVGVIAVETFVNRFFRAFSSNKPYTFEVIQDRLLLMDPRI